MDVLFVCPWRGQSHATTRIRLSIAWWGLFGVRATCSVRTIATATATATATAIARMIRLMIFPYTSSARYCRLCRMHGLTLQPFISIKNGWCARTVIFISFSRMRHANKRIAYMLTCVPIRLVAFFLYADRSRVRRLRVLTDPRTHTVRANGSVHSHGARKRIYTLAKKHTAVYNKPTHRDGLIISSHSNQRIRADGNPKESPSDTQSKKEKR